MGFFDNLSKKATETYKNTTDKTSKMAREMRLKSYIGENKNKIQGIYTQIGKKVYEKHVEGKISEIEGYIQPELDQIAETTRKIENMNNEIRALNNLKLCQSCSAEIDLSARFCPKCGVEQKVEQNSENNAIDNAIKAEPTVFVQKEEVVEPTEVPVEETAEVPVEEPTEVPVEENNANNIQTPEISESTEIVENKPEDIINLNGGDEANN